jgi:deoxyribonuclease IV
VAEPRAWPAGPAAGPAVGAHVPVAGGLAAGLRYADAIGAEAVQVFVSNPRSWALPGPDAGRHRAAADQLAAAGRPLFVHSPYLVNVGSMDQVIRDRSVASLRHSLLRGAALGVRGVVLHAGSAAGGDRDKGLRYARECLLPLLDSIRPGGPDLLVEPTAGLGQMLCRTVAELPAYLDALDWHPRAGVCLDTCHAFAAGHDLAAPGGAAGLLDELAAALPGRRLRLIHANDARDPCGSRRDRHQNIGAGHLGAEPFRALLRHPVTAQVPFIIETPGPQTAQAADVATLKRLRDRGY